MDTNLHLEFNGTCDAAFTFYETVFATKRLMSMTWGQAPPDVPCPEGAQNLVMHTALKLGSITLMGADAPPGRSKPLGGFEISLDGPDEPEVRRLFAALCDGGSVKMPLTPTFWSPLFGMCTDKFGVPWMIGVTGPQA